MTNLITAIGLGAAAGWVLKKLAGPTLDEIGSDLKSIYTSYRAKNLKAILEKAAPLLEQKPNDAPMSPKLLATVIDRASYENNDNIQDMWAKLIATSTTDNESDSLFLAHALSFISPREAEQFQFFCGRNSHKFHRELENSELQNDYVGFAQSAIQVPLPSNEMAFQQSLQNLWDAWFIWPAKIISAQVPTLSAENFVHSPYYTSKDYNNHRKEYDILDMTGLLRKETHRLDVGNHSVTISVYELSKIGLELYRRVHLDWEES